MKPTFKIVLTAATIAVLSSCSSSTQPETSKNSPIDLDTNHVIMQSDSVAAKSAEPDSFPNNPETERDTVNK